MTRFALVTAAACLLAAPVFAAGPPQGQLAASLGLSEAEAAKLSTHQLALIKGIKDNPRLSEGDKRRRIKWILEGTVPRFTFSF